MGSDDNNWWLFKIFAACSFIYLRTYALVPNFVKVSYSCFTKSLKTSILALRVCLICLVKSDLIVLLYPSIGEFDWAYPIGVLKMLPVTKDRFHPLF